MENYALALPRSEEKRNALFEAATLIISTQGIGAPTAAIAKLANVAEGTLFRYFATKDELLNELYLHIKSKLADATRIHISSGGDTYNLALSIWNTYIDWGTANLPAIKTLQQLAVSEKITSDTHLKASKMRPEVQEIVKACVSKDIFRGWLSER